MIFDEATVRKLNRLTLVARRVRAGVLKGERRSSKRGAGTEFADYRMYSPGDDLRRIDWNVYARLDRPFLKLFEEEEDLAVHIFVDASLSMDWGEGEENKFRYGCKLAAALGTIALANGDALTLLPLAGAKGQSPFGPTRGENNTSRLLLYLENQVPGGEADLGGSLKRYALSAHRPGLAFLISDILASGEALDGPVALQGRGYEVTLIHLLSSSEIDPPFRGDLRLVDVETRRTQEISLDGELRLLYKQRLQDWQNGIAATCRKRGIRYLPLSTHVPWEKFVLQEMRKTGVVK